MHDVTTRTVGALIAAMLAGPVSAGDAMPKAVGSCTRTVVVATGTRFSDKLLRPKSRDVDEGISIELKNGVS